MNPTVRGISPIIDGYLDELDAATQHLPADERYEIRSSIEEHIADATHGAARISDDDARRIVHNLGPVSSIVTPAPRPAAAHTPAIQPAAPGMNSSRIAVVLATVTTATMFFFPFFAVIMGLLAIGFGIMGVRRREPNRREAWIAIICGTLPFVLMTLMAVFASAGSSSTSVG